MIKSQDSVYIHIAKRSPIGKFGGALKHFSAVQLAAETLKKAAQQTTGSTKQADKVIMGHARQAGCGPNPARQAACLAGFSNSIPAWTINQACASGLAAVSTAFDRIRFGLDQKIWAGGVESMSNTPYLLREARWGKKAGHTQVVDGMYQDGFFCPMADMLMGETVEEHIAKEEKISRDEQDLFALESQQKAKRAGERGAFQSEIVPFEGVLDFDEHVRKDATIEKLKKLKTVFDPENGSITAGNASGITDGAAWLCLSSEKENSMPIEIIDYQMTALDPKKMGLGPIESVQKLLERQQLSLNEIDFFELNEAFAAQCIACQKHLQIPSEKINVHGGSIALGHPIGATGARILVTLTHTLLQSSKPQALGVASLCVSGGMGYSLLLKKHT